MLERQLTLTIMTFELRPYSLCHITNCVCIPSSPGYDYWVEDVRDSNLYYEMVVMPNDASSVGTNYTFDAKIAMMYGAHTETYTPSVAVMDKEAAVVR